ncbi:MAG: hypothetical protein CEN88_389 [Candidatus Berkelbacteria bacterium Licking1014_2]|uniref:Uncharacterized protein n=1 Tax=Candidatus Berkelbacteria bacterium Licking1014_2 TaxID=2017146 RepID=A0A554LTI5_9BACT|nr:MAG: hypothetical protein CEN88_389 [Candidatus Berkelbacteria bacterium Licking1014_2]
MEFEKLLIKVVKILDEIDAIYCLTGGYAVSCWGRPRATFDLDVVIKLPAEKISIFAPRLKSLSDAGYINEIDAKEKLKVGGEFNFIHPETGLKIDFWSAENNSFSHQELKRRVAKKINNQTVYFISPEDLILSKLIWYQESQSKRHLDDAQSVIEIQGDKLDFSYLNREAGKLNIGKLWQEIKS